MNPEPESDFRSEIRDRLEQSYTSRVRGSQPVGVTAGSSAAAPMEFSDLQRAVEDARASYAVAGTLPPEPPTLRGRMGGRLVRLVQRALFWYTPQLVQFHYATVSALEKQLAAARRLAGALDELAANHTVLDQQLHAEMSDLRDELAGARSELADAVKLATTRAQEVRVLNAKLTETRNKLERLETGGPVASAGPEVASPETSHRLDGLYLALADRLQGSRDQVRTDLRRYLPYLQRARAGEPGRPVLDAQCGRGEWLELLKSEDLEASGVDRNRAMVALCVRLGLPASEDGPVERLRSAADQSLGAVTAFDLIERLSLDEIVDLFGECARALKPGGILIIETPDFHLHPARRQPVPAELARFLVESSGFGGIEMLDLDPGYALVAARQDRAGNAEYLEALQRNWDEFGKTDPLYAICSAPETRGNKWDQEAFFAKGRKEIHESMARAQSLGVPARRGSALDFGCGVGRLTQALCEWFDECCGVDIAPSMIQLAESYNKFGARCQYMVNAGDDLRQFADASFDLVYSTHVLQHMQAPYAKGFLREFVRVLRPGGLLVFQEVDQPALASEESTRATGPLPDDAYRAEIIPDCESVKTTAGAAIHVPVIIRNVSRHQWHTTPSRDNRYMVSLGNHWLTADGERVQWEDSRERLKRDIPPGGELQATITVTAPRRPGNYILELDLVQEGVAWFQQKSSTPARIPVEVSPGGIIEETPKSEGEAFQPVMDMYGIDRDEVRSVIAEAGARLLYLAENDFGGDDWISVIYFATR